LAEELVVADEFLGLDDSGTLRIAVNLGWALRSQGRLADAEPYYRRTLEGRERSLGPDHQYTLRVMAQLGNLISQRGRHEEGERLARESLDRARGALPAGHSQLASILEYLAQILLDTDRPADAEPHLDEALAIRKEKGSPVQIAECESLLGACFTRLERFAKAEELLVRAYRVIHKDRGEGYFTRRLVRQRITDLCEQMGEPERERELLARIEVAGS
jgi:tetratricopeptide (TPR) repeat protein